MSKIAMGRSAYLLRSPHFTGRMEGSRNECTETGLDVQKRKSEETGWGLEHRKL